MVELLWTGIETLVSISMQYVKHVKIYAMLIGPTLSLNLSLLFYCMGCAFTSEQIAHKCVPKVLVALVQFLSVIE